MTAVLPHCIPWYYDYYDYYDYFLFLENDRHFMRCWSVLPGRILHEGDQLHPP